MQVVLKIYVYYNDKLFGIFHSGFKSKHQISCLDGLIKHETLHCSFYYMYYVDNFTTLFK